MEQKLIQIGNSIGITLPAFIRNQLNLQIGDTVVVGQKNNQITVSPKNPVAVDAKFAKIVDDFITEQHDVLVELAKK